jgi:predicted O-methyltransferase YrrM
MIEVPFGFARRATMHLLPHLRPGGRWVEQCLPRERWERNGRPAFADWRAATGGDAVAGAEWYDLDRMGQRFAPVAVTPLLAFCQSNEQLAWFDLRVETVPDRSQAARYLIEGAGKRLQLGLSPASFKRHGGSEIVAVDTPAGPALRVRTPPQRWSYAVGGTLGANTLRQALAAGAGDDALATVEVAISVQQGRVGVGLLADDMKTYVAPERHVGQCDEPARIRLVCPPGHWRYHVMLRNTQGGDRSSAFTIHEMALGSVRAGEPVDAADAAAGAPPVVALTDLVRRHLPAIRSDGGAMPVALDDVPVFVRAVAIDDLDRALDFAEPSRAIATDRRKSLRAWTMETDDAPILAYLYRNHQPKRHLEFGTWEGFGATLCAAHSDAEIWTLNLPDGERTADGMPVYSRAREGIDELPEGAVPIAGDRQDGGSFQTDAGAFVGWRYRKAGFAHRVHQILVDTRIWDTSAFAAGFFDSVLIDGGHQMDVVTSDTDKALPLLRSGGLMLWHDFGPADGPMADAAATRGVVAAIHQNWRRWSTQFATLFWIRPSYLLLGVKR